MFRNYLAAALRNLARNRLHAAITIVGMAIGFAAALLIALFVRDELSYDRWIPGHENVVRLVWRGGPAQRTDTDASSPPEAAWFTLDIPEVQAAVRLWPQRRGLRHGGVEANETIVWADPQFFDLFPLPVIDGDPATALQAPDAVVITRRLAHKYFGRDRVVGETLELDRGAVLRVAAVLEDLPSRTHFNVDIVASGLAAASPLAAPYAPDRVTFGELFTYLRLAPGTLERVRAQLPDLADRRLSMKQFRGLYGPDITARELVTFELQPLASLHLAPPKLGYVVFNPDLPAMLKPSGDPGLVAALAAVGGLILLVALVNFVHHMTARASRRAVEVGVRKSSGARRRDLMLQFLGESFLWVAAGLVLAIMLVEALLPGFNAFLGRAVAFDYGRDPALAGFLVALLLLAGIGGGLYPAFVLASFRPASVLKGAVAGPGGSARLRQSLVVAQFAVLIGLMVATSVIARQTRYAMQDAFRLDTDQLLFIDGPCRAAFTDTVAALPGVRGAACAHDALTGLTGIIGIFDRPDGTRLRIEAVHAQPGLLELYGVKPLAGTLPAPGSVVYSVPWRPGRAPPIVINAAAMRLLGFATPDAAIGQFLPGRQDRIVAVVPDFPVRSLREPIAPTLFVDPGDLSIFNRVVVKLDGSRLAETLAGIDRAWAAQGLGRPIVRQFYAQHVEAQYRDILRATDAFTLFSLVAVGIAMLGLFGLAAFTAERRTKEIGIRKAMGAGVGEILRLLLWQFARPVLWANLIAWPAAFFVMRRWLQGFAYHIDLQPWMFLAAGAAALAIALATVAGHSLLVARTRPVLALRYE